MIQFSLSEIGISALGAAALGAVFGFSYQMLCSLRCFLSSLISTDWKTIIYKNGTKSIYNSLKSKMALCEFKSGHILNFLFTLIFGAFYLVMQFVLCDGVFRLYFLLITALFFFLIKHLSYRFFSGIFPQMLVRFCAIFIFAAGCIIRLFSIILKFDEKNATADMSAP